MKHIDRGALRKQILEISDTDEERHYLSSLVDQIYLITNTLSVLDKYADIQEQRKAYLGFLFYFDPKFLRIATLIHDCSAESVKNNRNNLIRYIHDTYPTFDSSMSIALYESITNTKLGCSWFISPKINCSKRKSKIHIAFDEQMTKSECLKYMNENWELIHTLQSSNERINKKIISKTLVDFLIYFGFSTEKILKFTDIYFSEETGLANKIRDSFTKESIRSQKSALKKCMENDAMHEAYCKYLRIIDDPKRHKEIYQKITPLTLLFDNDKQKFDIKE